MSAIETPLCAVGHALVCGCPGYGWDADLQADLCVCPARERALRAFMERRPGTPDAMTVAQRDWCLAEIDRVEGYRRADHADEADADLARTVLCAWTDFVRDKGLIR